LIWKNKPCFRANFLKDGKDFHKEVKSFQNSSRFANNRVTCFTNSANESDRIGMQGLITASFPFAFQNEPLNRADCFYDSNQTLEVAKSWISFF